MKGRLNVQKCTLCVCVLTLILVCVLLYQRNVTEGFKGFQNKNITEEKFYDEYIKIGKGKKGFGEKGKRDGRGQGKHSGKHKFDEGQGQFIGKGKGQGQFIGKGKGQGGKHKIDDSQRKFIDIVKGKGKEGFY